MVFLVVRILIVFIWVITLCNFCRLCCTVKIEVWDVCDHPQDYTASQPMSRLFHWTGTNQFEHDISGLLRWFHPRAGWHWAVPGSTSTCDWALYRLCNWITWEGPAAWPSGVRGFPLYYITVVSRIHTNMYLLFISQTPLACHLFITFLTYLNPHAYIGPVWYFMMSVSLHWGVSLLLIQFITTVLNIYRLSTPYTT